MHRHTSRTGAACPLRRRLPRFPVLVFLGILCLAFASGAARAQTLTKGVVECTTSISVVWSTQKPEEDKYTFTATGTYLTPEGRACLGNVSATVKIKIKWYDIQGREIDQRGALVPADPEYPRYEHEVLPRTGDTAVGTSKVSGTAVYDGYYKVWYIRPINAATAWRSYKIYASAGSQDARNSAEDKKETDAKRTVFVRLPDGTPPDESPLQYP